MPRYIVQLLDRLGYKASRKSFPIPPLGTPFLRPPPRTCRFFTGWVADYPSAAAFIRPNSAAGSQRLRILQSEDSTPRCDGQQALEPTDPHAADARWAHIDHELVDAAPWIPYSNGRKLDFVSKRVGNFQFHPEWGVLFDQLWVR